MNNAFNVSAFSFDSKQLDSLFTGPARAYASLSVDYTEKLVNAQYEATKAYADASLAQLRGLLNIQDAAGLRSYLEGQQQVAKDLGERLKGDAEKVVALNQDFFQQSQKLAESNLKQAQAASPAK